MAENCDFEENVEKELPPELNPHHEVEFLYKTMRERDPSKRRVKPVQDPILQVGFDDDDSDDEDFQIKYRSPDIDDSSCDDDDDTIGLSCDIRTSAVNNVKRRSDNSVTNTASESVTDSDSSTSSSSSSNADDECGSSVSSHRAMTVGELVQAAHIQQTAWDNTWRMFGGRGYRNVEVLICAVCLKQDRPDDEVIACDACGISVHEGCYGDCIGDSDSIASDHTESSTEPWFCDTCQAGVDEPSCELCPNTGGLFKETDQSKWVHVVCALYTPGVAFCDINKLTPVTLSEIHSTRWGTKECCVCEDIIYNRTGVCIGCDAGLCRNYFHVTCAQKQGLLSEATGDDPQHVLDPLHAYCRIHVDKTLMKAKITSYLALIAKYKSHRINNDERIQTKLSKYRNHYLIVKSTTPPPFVPLLKYPRLISTCPSACRRLLKKAELLGYNTDLMPMNTEKCIGDIRKKWYIRPALTTQFVDYYLDRDRRLIELNARLKHLMGENEVLQNQQKQLRNLYDKAFVDLDTIRDANFRLISLGTEFHDYIARLSNKQVHLPDILTPLKQDALKKASDIQVEGPKLPVIIHECGICRQTTDQHLLTQCDTCNSHYHIGCLNPPLTRMPKKTKTSIWQCMDCVGSSSDSSDISHMIIENTAEFTADGRRSHRAIKEPLKFSPLDSEEHSHRKRKRKCKRRQKNRENISVSIVDESGDPLCISGTPGTSQEPVEEAAERPPSAKRARKQGELMSDCTVCSNSGNSKSLVKCDECSLCYHLTCLIPPLEKNPKIRGYVWICEECDKTPNELSDVPDL